MRKLSQKLKASVAVMFLAGMVVSSSPAYAIFPVLDAGNLTQNIMNYVESVAHTMKQIEQYQTQLQQYETELQNSVAPAAYVWNQAQQTIAKLENLSGTLNLYKSQLGNLDSYLDKFGDVNYYSSSPCFTAAGCTQAQWDALEKNNAYATTAQKTANDALFRGLEQQQTNITTDAATLQTLQNNASSAKGQMQAIGYANQLAGLQNAQLLQIRNMLMAQQAATTARMQAQNAREAESEALSQQMMKHRIVSNKAAAENWLNN